LGWQHFRRAVGGAILMIVIGVIKNMTSK